MPVESVSERTQQWAVEIRRVVEGERQAHLYHHSTADGYLEQKLALSPDRPVQETAFYAALKEVVSDWKPQVHNERCQAELSRMLDILKHFLPENGFLKVGDLVRQGRLVGLKIDTESRRGLDLHRQALICLRGYCPNTNSPHFAVYKQILHSHIADPYFEPYQEYAATHLLEMEVLSANRAHVIHALKMKPAILPQVIRGILAKYYRIREVPEDTFQTLKQEFADLLEVCFDAFNPDVKTPWTAFISAMEQCGFTVRKQEGEVQIAGFEKVVSRYLTPQEDREDLPLSSRMRTTLFRVSFGSYSNQSQASVFTQLTSSSNMTMVQSYAN